VIRLEGSMVQGWGKKHPKNKKGSKVRSPKRLTAVQCWVNTRSGTG